MTNNLVALKDLLAYTRDGEWGQGSPADDLIEMLVIRGTDFESVRYGDLAEVPTRFIPQHIATKKQLQLNDILIETAGGSKGQPTGKTLLITERIIAGTSLPVTCASFCRFLRVNETVAIPEYLFWYLQHLYASGETYNYQVQHTGIARFQYTVFAENTVIALPPMEQQREIAAILGSLDDKIELNRRMNATLEATARALFKSWFVDFDPVRAKSEGRDPDGMDAETAALFPDAFEESELGPIPLGWRVSTVGEEVHVYGGSTPSTKEPLFWEGGIHAWATPKDLSGRSTLALLDTSRQITDQGLKQISSGLLPAGTVLLSSRAPIGYLAISAIPVAVNQGFIAMVCDRRLPNYYVLMWTAENMDTIKGKANGTTFMEVSKGSFRPIPVLVPSVEVLQVFNHIIAPLFEHIIMNEWISRTLAETRDALLPKLISGQVRVGEAMT